MSQNRVAPISPPPSAIYPLAVLFTVNVANYVARNVLGAVLPALQREFGAGDALAGLVGSALMWAYMLSALGFGPLADRAPRNRILGFGAAVWAIGAAGCSAAGSIPALLGWRAVIGLGEAAFSIAAPAMIADLFPRSRRNRAFTLFYIALPVGAGLGFALGGALGENIGWRGALLATGLPGLALAPLAWSLREPRRGSFDTAATEPPQPMATAARRLWSIRSFRWALAGQVLLYFAVGAVAAWLPTFLVRAHDMSLEHAGLVSGASLALGSLLGTLAGGALADLWARRSRNALIHTSSIGIAVAALLTPLVLVSRQDGALFPLLVLVNFFLFWHTGPVNTLLAGVAPPAIRATSVAVQILVIHLFGDAVSPALLGAASDALQQHGFDAGGALRWALMVSLAPSLLLAAAVTQVAALWAPDDLAAVGGHG